MNIYRDMIGQAVSAYCGVRTNTGVHRQAIAGWNDIARILCITPKAVQIDLANDPFWLHQDKSSLKLVMVATPPDEFAILSTTVGEIIAMRDHGEIPDVWILTVREYALLRQRGPMMWERFVDLKSRFPQAKNILDGELGLDRPTQARFYPYCTDRKWLELRRKIRRLACSVKRTNAVWSRWHPACADTNFH